ncbi:Os02g0446100, partial [Oryza sativa Japonica Group]
RASSTPWGSRGIGGWIHLVAEWGLRPARGHRPAYRRGPEAGVSSIELICRGACIGLYTRSSSAAAPRVPPRRVFSLSENSYGDRWPSEVDGAAGGKGLPVYGLALAFLVVSVSYDKCLRGKV